MARAEDDLGIDSGSLEEIRRIMSSLTDSDFDLISPPGSIWAGVQATASSQLARTPPQRDPQSQTMVEYWIDADDFVINVGHNWADFAAANDAPELAAGTPQGTLWSFMGQEEIREIWQLLVSRVRALQSEAHVPFRCDASDTRRWFEMSVTPESDGKVHFQSKLIFEEARQPVELLDVHVDRDTEREPIHLCSWCCRGQHDEQWLDIEEVARAGRLLEREALPQVSYGICGPCREEMSAELLVPAVAGTSPS